MRQAVWPGAKSRFEIDCFDLLQPRRRVSHRDRYRSGLFHSDKCGREIQYESALELSFVQRLEADPHVVFYWEQPVRLPYRRGRRRLFYTPDYGIYLDTGHFLLAEVKELPAMLDYRVQRKIEVLAEFCLRRGFGMLLTDGRHGPEALLKNKINRKLEKALSAALERHPLDAEQCRELLGRCHATAGELYKAIIRHNLKFRLFPMKLQRGNDNALFRQLFFERRKPPVAGGDPP